MLRILLLPWRTISSSSSSSNTTTNGRRKRILLCVFLICCLPVLIPLAFLSFPLLCVSAFCLKFRFGWLSSPPTTSTTEEARAEGGEGHDEGEVEELEGGLLLQRYLEDQLGLVGSLLRSCSMSSQADIDTDADTRCT